MTARMVAATRPGPLPLPRRTATRTGGWCGWTTAWSFCTAGVSRRHDRRHVLCCTERRCGPSFPLKTFPLNHEICVEIPIRCEPHTRVLFTSLLSAHHPCDAEEPVPRATTKLTALPASPNNAERLVISRAVRACRERRPWRGGVLSRGGGGARIVRSRKN